MDKSHAEQIKRWAVFCRDNPNEFRKYLNPFLDAQILIARAFYNRLIKRGDKKIVERLRATK